MNPKIDVRSPKTRPIPKLEATVRAVELCDRFNAATGNRIDPDWLEAECIRLVKEYTTP